MIERTKYMMKRCFGAAAIVSALLVQGAALAADKTGRPNLDGVWLGVRVQGTTGGGGPGPDWPVDKMTPAAKEAKAKFVATYGNDAPEAGSYCVHNGMPGMMTSVAGYPIEIISNDKQINLAVETGSFRRIFLDGRKAPTDRPPTSGGYSVGRWEGNVLVVETTGLAAKVAGRVMSDQARVTERIYLVDDKGGDSGGIAGGMITEKGGKILVDEITVNDPKFYTVPIKFTAKFRRTPDDAMLEYDCGAEFWEAALEEHAKKRSKR
jgi:hypothetical protein